MLSKLLLTGAMCLCLMGCAPLLPPPVPRLIPPSLTAPCLFVAPEVRTNGELARAYVSSLDALADCSARHKALGEALK